jgi:phosphatidylglycerophosphate synthase
MLLGAGHWFVVACMGVLVLLGAALALLPSGQLLTTKEIRALGPTTERVFLGLRLSAMALLTVGAVLGAVDGDFARAANSAALVLFVLAAGLHSTDLAGGPREPVEEGQGPPA